MRLRPKERHEIVHEIISESNGKASCSEEIYCPGILLQILGGGRGLFFRGKMQNRNKFSVNVLIKNLIKSVGRLSSDRKSTLL